MFVAGHETTATALGWMMYHLATLPEIQQKLKEEVDRALKGQPITQDNIKDVRFRKRILIRNLDTNSTFYVQLTYMSNVIKENLRIQPPVAYLPTRSVKEDIEFEGKIIPKGVSSTFCFCCHMTDQCDVKGQIGLNMYAIHRNPEFWPEPEKFDPERFTKPQVPFSFLPFSLKSRAW